MKRVPNHSDPSRQGAHGRPKPTPKRVYYGHTAVGEIEDWGKGDIRAFDLTPSGRVAVGTFPDRRSAMRAVGRKGEAKEAATREALEKLAEPAEFASGLPQDNLGGGKRR
jgi:hypothetical protein